MLEKLAAGMLGSAVSSLLGGMFGDAKKVGGAAEADAGLFTKMLGKARDGADVAVNETEGMDADTAAAWSQLKEMTSGGVEGYWKYMIKQLREQTMEAMGVTEESLAAMEPGQREAIEAKIAEKVKEGLAKVMGVEPDAANQMITLLNRADAINAANMFEARKAYKNDVLTV